MSAKNLLLSFAVLMICGLSGWLLGTSVIEWMENAQPRRQTIPHNPPVLQSGYGN